MNDRIQKVKIKLLELGYKDNEWLNKYLEMLEDNLNTSRNRKSTQAHHAIPVNSYWTSDEPYNRKEAAKLARLDNTNFEVNLLYKDHLLVHSYLTLCTDLDTVQKRYEAQAERRKHNSQIALAVSFEKGTNALSPYYTPSKLTQQTKQAKRARSNEYLKQYYSAEDAEEILNL